MGITIQKSFTDSDPSKSFILVLRLCENGKVLLWCVSIPLTVNEHLFKWFFNLFLFCFVFFASGQWALLIKFKLWKNGLVTLLNFTFLFVSFFSIFFNVNRDGNGGICLIVNAKWGISIIPYMLRYTCYWIRNESIWIALFFWMVSCFLFYFLSF